MYRWIGGLVDWWRMSNMRQLCKPSSGSNYEMDTISVQFMRLGVKADDMIVSCLCCNLNGQIRRPSFT